MEKVAQEEVMEVTHEEVVEMAQSFPTSVLLPQNYITLTSGLCCLCGEESCKEPVGLRERRS